MPRRHFDGDGLVFLVRKAERKLQDAQDEQLDRTFWLFRYSSGRRIREAGLGRARGHNAVILAEARERALRIRDKLREGKDPLTERAEQVAKAKAQQS